VEFGSVIAAPFACSLLADLGAEVVKVERPDGGGDVLRTMGPRKEGVPLWWGVASRNKRCVALDLKKPDDRRRFEALVAGADVLVENNRPGVMDRLGLGWEALSARNPRLVMVSISGFGQTGPDAARPGFGKIAEAMSGVVVLTGAPGAVPLHVGFSLADTAAGLAGLFGVSLALFLRDAAPGGGGTGRGARVDVGLYEPLLRMADCQLALREALGAPPLRQGSNDPYGWGAAAAEERAVRCLRCSDGAWLAVLLDTTARLHLGARPDGELERLAAARPRGAALEALRALGLEAAPVHDGSSLAADPYFAERGEVAAVRHPEAGALAVPGILPRGTYDTGALRHFHAPPEAATPGRDADLAWEASSDAAAASGGGRRP
jgi:crotonobetainyl-CoA:carnitine CoA-transferase CaiB-like acyl-CoA transferase